MLNRIFVYGSLRLAHDNKFARLLHESSTFLGEASMRGRKQQIGEYSGMVPAFNDTDRVDGEVFEMRDPGGILNELDVYEGPDYQREIQPALLSASHSLDCWVYLYLPKVVNRADQS